MGREERRGSQDLRGRAWVRKEIESEERKLRGENLLKPLG